MCVYTKSISTLYFRLALVVFFFVGVFFFEVFVSLIVSIRLICSLSDMKSGCSCLKADFMFSTWQEYSNAATDPVVLLLLWCRWRTVDQLEPIEKSI